MATLLLTAVGTALGGPIGGAIGALAGRQIDNRIIGSGSREGPRMQELKVTTSSYGQPLARHYGSMRVAGTVIWATDLKESRETSGGGKGKPKTMTYSYSVSFAVALSSRPLDAVGRIWADGNLLRGAAGDLKVGGSLRIYNGWGDQPLDPLLSSAEGTSCPAFRGTAYAVFEDLQLADFGNRIPALSFEVSSGSGSDTIPSMLADQEDAIAGPGAGQSQIGGFSWAGGTLEQSLAVIDEIQPLVASTDGASVTIDNEVAGGAMVPILLSDPVTSWTEGDFGEFSGHRKRRGSGSRERPEALRYYDPERDYQPGTQRALGRTVNAFARTIEFPGTLSSAAARSLIDKAAHTSDENREVLSWRTAELDSAIRPGVLVNAPGFGGEWRVNSLEWREAGIELELVRTGSPLATGLIADPGRSWTSPDLAFSPTILRAFELPLENPGQSELPQIYAAMTSQSAGWPGATLYAEFAGELVPINTAGRVRAMGGSLMTALAPSQSVRLEAASTIDIDLVDNGAELQSTSLTALAFGANRALIGGEIIQFANAEKINETTWRLTGILRGRGGTEAAASLGNPVGADITILDDLLLPLDSLAVAGADRLAAIGPADAVPAYAAIENAGATLKPLTPVHPRSQTNSNGEFCLAWTRRARGAWAWIDEVEVPLVEEAERYQVGIGTGATPIAQWETTEPSLVIDSGQFASLQSNHPGETMWVRQIGSHARSDPLALAIL